MASEGSAPRVFRVTVRGRFRDLTDEARRHLVAEQPEHDVFRSAYTPEGTFTYDERVLFFNLRYEVRAGTADAASDRALAEATTFLRTMRFDHGDLKATTADLTAVWDDAARRGRR